MIPRQKLLQALEATEQDLEREDWSWEQFVERLIPNLQSYSQNVKELADPKNMPRSTREVLEMYESTLWLTDEEVAARTHTNVPAAGARRRGLGGHI